MDNDWPFAEPPDSLVGVSERVLKDHRPILHVQHTSEYHETPWWFSDQRLGERLYGRAPLRQIVALDPTARYLTTLPIGWMAWRLTVRDRWHRMVIATPK
jgi:hypothetical protein